MKKAALIKKITALNKTHLVKIQGTEKERLVFNNPETWELFGASQEILEPFNDYSYNWLSSFFDDLLDYLQNHEDLKDFEDEMHERIDSQIDIYTSDLCAWLADRNDNIYFLSDALQEMEIKNGFQALQCAQMKAIEEIYYNALRIVEAW